MEVGDEIFSMFEFSGWKPREFFISVFVTKPSDKVQEFARTSMVNLGV